QSRGRRLSLGNKLDEVREFGVDSLPFRLQVLELLRVTGEGFLEGGVRGADEVVDHLGRHALLELLDQLHLQDGLRDGHAVRADTGPLRDMEGASIAPVAVDDPVLLALTGLDRNPGAAGATPNQSREQVRRVQLGRLAARALPWPGRAIRGADDVEPVPHAGP